MLVHWLKNHLGDENMGQKLKLFTKECEQGNDTAMLAISNISALARGYACADDTDPLSLRSDLVRKMKALRQSNKPSKRLNQWTTIYGLRTADSLFSFGMPPPKPPKSDTTESKKPSSSLSSYMISPPAPAPSKKRKPSTQARPVAPSDLRTPFAPDPSMPSSNKRTPAPPVAASDLRNLFGVSPSVAPSNKRTPSPPTPPVAPSNKRKAGASSTVTGVPAKRRQVADPPKEETSSWCFSTWWGKKKDLDVARESMEKLQGELEKARANVQDIKHEIRVLEKRK
ncbi:hypothetical protein CDV31_000955 [Fusarium ambrosium]|uniref:Uncharacterized protein n=1 Tax=Fusarium ambrosium TaxID=131363 RepID=A0A428V0W1_9HYPO|nr:hypothetical protein CDV31_000955 [Fusarium ambrosium]